MNKPAAPDAKCSAIPIGALVDFARCLRARGASLQAGDMVATGSCTGLTQAIPGQGVEAVFEGLRQHSSVSHMTSAACLKRALAPLWTGWRLGSANPAVASDPPSARHSALGECHQHTSDINWNC